VDPALSLLLFLSQHRIWLLTLSDPAASVGCIVPSEVSMELCKHTAVDISIWPALLFSRCVFLVTKAEFQGTFPRDDNVSSLPVVALPKGRFFVLLF